MGLTFLNKWFSNATAADNKFLRFVAMRLNPSWKIIF
jgi:hypothetical protein